MLNKKYFESSSFRILVLYAFAVAQPMLALLSGTPEFFAARGSNSGEVLLWLLVLVVLAPLALIVLIELVCRLNSRLGLCLQLFVAFVLLISLTIPIFKAAAVMPVGVLEVAVLAVPALSIFIYVRFVPIRSMVSLMGIGLIAFPLVFLLSPGISQLVFYSEGNSSSSNGGGEGVPIVMIVFDELPLFSLMNMDMRINAQRNPNFAALANESTWYRNATTVADFTLGAIPSLLTGNYPPRDALMPFYGNHQQNLFTVLEGSHQIRAVEGAAVLLSYTYLRGQTKKIRWGHC